MATPNQPTNGSNPSDIDPDYFDRLMDLDAEAAVQVEATESQPSDVPRFKRYSWAEMMVLPSKEWIIDQIIGKRDLFTIYGPPSGGKTFTAVDMAVSACLGKPWAGRFEVPQPLTVAYAIGEGGSGFAQRLQAAGEYYGVDDIPNLIIYMTAPQLFNSQDPCNAAQFVLEYAAAQASGDVEPLDILFLDTLHSVTAGADENSSQHMGQVLHQAKTIADRLGCAVCLVHHTNKAGTGERGSSALRGAMDCMIEVKEIGSSRLMTCEKLKDGEAWKPQTFDLVAKADSVRVDWGDVGEVSKTSGQQAIDKERLRDVMGKNPGVKFNVGSLAEAIGKGDNHTRNLLSQMERDGNCVRELADPDKPSSSRNPWVYSHKNLT
jgi:hypothetical protein